MKLYRTLEAFEAPPGGVAMSIGVFDGVHRGHRMLVEKACARGKELGLPSLVFTFSAHPLAFLAPPYAPPLLSTAEEKAELLRGLGVDHCIMIDFTAGFAATRPETFLRDAVAGICRARYLVCGRDFHFGAQGAGDVALLARMAPELNLEVEVCPDLLDSGGPVKSSRVRQHLLEGDIGVANRLLARNYSLTGVVIEGDRRGRTIGYPTANLEPAAGILVPKNGVYAIKANGEDLQRGGMLNIGIRPTFEPGRRTIEAHLFDYAGDLYGKPLTIEFVARIRDEKKFAGVEELRSQLRADEAKCRRILSE